MTHFNATAAALRTAVEAFNCPWVLDTETDGLEVRNGKHTARWIGLLPLNNPDDPWLWKRDAWTQAHADIIVNLQLIGHNIRFDLHALRIYPLLPPVDTMLICYYNNTSQLKDLDTMARVMRLDKIPTPKLIKDGRVDECPDAEVMAYLADDLYTTAKLAGYLRRLKTYAPDFALEMAVLRMEQRGVRLLPDALADIGVQVDASIVAGLAELRAAGYAGAVNNPKQVGEYLAATGRRLPRTASGKGFATTKIVLQQLEDAGDALVGKLLSVRRAMKLRDAFVRPLPTRTDPEGMLYPSVKTAHTRTGRFSCEKPNLQQIPKRGSGLAKGFRACFTSRSGRLAGADFSQVELRVAAALSGETVLLEAFEAGRCPHRAVAQLMTGRLPEDMADNDLDRFRAKVVNFGILNGMGAPRLAVELKAHLETARHFLDNYRRRLPALTEWMEGVWRSAEGTMLAQTAAGRTRIYGTGDDNPRSAMSVVVSGTAAELMRAALLALDAAGAAPILTVHDEALCDAEEGRLTSGEDVGKIMTAAANAAFKTMTGTLPVDFVAVGGIGRHWGEI